MRWYYVEFLVSLLLPSPAPKISFSFSSAAGLWSPNLFLDPTILFYQLFVTKRTELAPVLRQAHSATICGTLCLDDCHIVRKQIHQWRARRLAHSAASAVA